MSYYDIPDHPVIQNCERTGYPYGTPKYPVCPCCHEECGTVYLDEMNDVVGCDVCVEKHSADCEEVDACPECGNPADWVYMKNNAVIGCDNCITERDAWEYDRENEGPDE